MEMKSKMLAMAAATMFVAGCANFGGASEGGVTASSNNCKGMAGCKGMYNGCNGFNNCLGKPQPVGGAAPTNYKGANSCKGKAANSCKG